ncbi:MULTISPECIES: FAD-dependent oxidoreductase [unclassified Crossiella]|uniref:FAD-dependent oxidoreductase n=1 Tax=unclassified Crossiella TaxID=2620835 RepID=UPI001FFE95DF|nr:MULTISPECIES: FAD-dependent oxidoreductase [unclassified Crossiella]MCK2241428.1 FAD-dependent oxidoreductase [Crossiella sp. S99.2]MCK2255700.1 FAD-dependent oxidoreductase [Crossiella sp. S99.1]
MTGVVVAGGGPGGMVLAYLLGRAGVPVTLLEAQPDFDRDFRGDSLHPYTLELLDTLGLAEDLLRLPHHPARSFRFHTPHGTITAADYRGLDSPFPYVALMPQVRFLDFLAGKAQALPSCQIRMAAKVIGLLREGEAVTGVRYRDEHGEHDLPATVVIGADGRFSRLRRLADLPVEPLGASSDLLWFRLPRHPADPPEADVDLYFGRDHYVALLGGVTDWQIGYTLPKGGFPAAKQAGVTPIQDFIHRHVPWLTDRITQLTGFDQITLLSLDIARAPRWHRPGVLLLGDAAHVISPVGGNGILMAVQDAVEAANQLIPALRAGALTESTLAAIQAAREPAIVQVQADQTRIERRVATAREQGKNLAPPSFLRLLTALPWIRTRSARRNAYGPRPPRLDTTLLDR